MKTNGTLFKALGVCLLLLTGACQSSQAADESLNTGRSPAGDAILQTPVSDSGDESGGTAMPGFSTINKNVTVVPVEITPAPPTQSVSNNQSFGPVLDAVISRAKSDLAQKINVSPDTIKVLEVEAVEWPDGSLGCGKPGDVYVQVITPGFLISLEADGRVFSYHTNTSTQIILCSEQPPHGTISTP